MNIQRAAIWIGFLGLSGALAWAPGHWFGLEDDVTAVAALQGSEASARASAPAQSPEGMRSAPGRAPAAARQNLFPAQHWTPPQSLASVTEQPLQAAPLAPVVPTAPALPFQFVGRLGDRDDLQIFLQNGEKLYVVRQGDVIEDTYRLDHVSASELSLVYLPLHQSQTLSVGSAP